MVAAPTRLHWQHVANSFLSKQFIPGQRQIVEVNNGIIINSLKRTMLFKIRQKHRKRDLRISDHNAVHKFQGQFRDHRGHVPSHENDLSALFKLTGQVECPENGVSHGANAYNVSIGVEVDLFNNLQFHLYFPVFGSHGGQKGKHQSRQVKLLLPHHIPC